jgi:WD40 repeat protein/tRNA A-37 threonylcarbamoyl transferase component Bud32
MVKPESTFCCLNPQCTKPENIEGAKFCRSCGNALTILRNHYRPFKLLSDEGGFGRTYLAEDLDKLREVCVIKQLAPRQQGTAALNKAKELFDGEAKQLQQLGDNSLLAAQIPQLLAYFEENGYLYLVQQYVPGKTLDRLESQPWNETEVRKFLASILPVLDFIHQHKIIHRDIKPANIIRRDGDRKYVLIDFGASKEFRASIALQGTMIGTFGYSPHEQFKEGEAYPASDLFSVGVTCFYLLTQVDPHELYLEDGYGWLKNWQQYLKQPISRELSQVLDKLLQKDRYKRYQSAKEVIEALKLPSSPESVSSFPETKIETNSSNPLPTVYSLPLTPEPERLLAKSPRKSIPILIVATTSILLMLGGGSYLLWNHRPNFSNLFSFSLFKPAYNYENLTLEHTITDHSQGVESVAFSPDGQSVASSSADQTVMISELTTGKLLKTFSDHSDIVVSVAFSPDDQYLASGSADQTIKIWDSATGQVLHTLTGHTDSIRSVAFSPDSQTLASGSWDKTIKLWDVATGEELHTFTGHGDWVHCVIFSPDGKLLASSSGDKTIKIWDLETNRSLRTLRGHTDGVISVAFSPNGKFLASASGDKTVKIWDLTTGQELQTLKGHSDWVWSVAFSPDGKYLASSSKDATIKIWQMKSGQLVKTLIGHTEWVNSIKFSPDGQYLVSGSDDKTVKIWRVEQ